MLREAFYDILKEDAEKAGKPFPRPEKPIEVEFAPRENSPLLEQIHDAATWPKTPGIECPKYPTLFCRWL